MNKENNKPEVKLSCGLVSVTGWKNTAVDKVTKKENSWMSFTTERGYKDDKEEWHNTTSMQLNDLPKVIALLQKMYDMYAIKERKD